MHRLTIALFTALSLIVGCQPCSVGLLTAGGNPDQAEALAGLRAARELEGCYGGVRQNAAAEARITRIAKELAAGNPLLPEEFHCHVLDCPKVNAFSLPGGRIYITRGLYERIQSDEVLAGVVAHELAHLASKDSFKPRCATQKERLEREISADVRGLWYLQGAGYSAEGLTAILQIIGPYMPEGWARKRIAIVQRTAAAQGKTEVVLAASE